MKTSIKQMVFCCLFIAMFGAYADESEDREDKDNRNPLGCRDVGYEFNLNSLHLKSTSGKEKQSLYFIYNESNAPITLYQMHDDESSRSLYLNHVIQGGQWAVLSTSQTLMKFICTVAEPKTRYGKVVNCSDKVRVCEFANVVYGLNNRGNYWLVNSNARNAAVRAVVHYGIIPQ